MSELSWALIPKVVVESFALEDGRVSLPDVSEAEHRAIIAALRIADGVIDLVEAMKDLEPK